jgi:hypothetical protein
MTHVSPNLTKVLDSIPGLDMQQNYREFATYLDPTRFERLVSAFACKEYPIHAKKKRQLNIRTDYMWVQQVGSDFTHKWTGLSN